jgi:hypothetical protein
MLLAALVLVSGACGRKPMNTTADALKAVPRENWGALAGARIYFGHQSVGFNLVDGMLDVMREVPGIRLRITESRTPAGCGSAFFAHSRIGRNTDALGKIEDFRAVMDSGAGGNVDIAFLKLCYVDIVKGTDVAAVFGTYVATIARLERKYPRVRFVHCTVPLTAAQTGIRARIKRLLGRPLWDDDDNIRRNEYNRLLVERYGTDNVFDLAGYESTCAGARAAFEKDGRRYYALAPGYARDKGHLNADGRKYLAGQLLLFLESRCRPRKE